MTGTDPNVRAAAADTLSGEAVTARLPVPDRLLPVWIGAAILGPRAAATAVS